MKPRRERKTVERFEAGDAGSDLKRKRQELQRQQSQSKPHTEHKPAQAVTEAAVDPLVGATVRVSVTTLSLHRGLQSFLTAAPWHGVRLRL